MAHPSPTAWTVLVPYTLLLAQQRVKPPAARKGQARATVTDGSEGATVDDVSAPWHACAPRCGVVIGYTIQVSEPECSASIITNDSSS